MIKHYYLKRKCLEYVSRVRFCQRHMLCQYLNPIISKDGTKLFEAPHGTAHDLYLRYLETDGREANFNSSALIFAVASALEELAVREDNAALNDYASRLKAALIETVAQGTITGDLKGKTTAPENERIVDMHGFLDAIAENLTRD